MATQIFPTLPLRIDRRRFLLAAMATIASTGVAERADAARPEVVRMGTPERPRSDIEAWNVGLVSARRPALAPAENLRRDGELRAEIRQHFSLFHLRGRYVADHGLPHAKTTEEYACFVKSHADDSGNLKGFLTKYGRRYGQDSVIYKGYYRDAVLIALRDLPTLGVKDGETISLGPFHPKRLGGLYTLMTRGGASLPSIALRNLQSGPEAVDWLGGGWEDISLSTPKSFFSRAERRVTFEEVPKPRQGSLSTRRAQPFGNQRGSA